MKLDKENYEFILFELLEGNLNESERQSVLNQIKANPFFEKEWILMQKAVAIPDMEVVMPKKSRLLKKQKVVFAGFGYFTPMRIAASLLLLAGVWYYFTTMREHPDIVSNTHTQPQKRVDQVQAPQVNGLQGSDESEKVTVANSEVPGTILNGVHTRHLGDVRNPEQDSIIEHIVPDPLHIASRNPHPDFAVSQQEPPLKTFSVGVQDTRNSKTYLLRKRIRQAEQLRNRTLMVLNDIPNLSLRLTPRLKTDKPGIGIVLRGEVVYASAKLELK